MASVFSGKEALKDTAANGVKLFVIVSVVLTVGAILFVLWMAAGFRGFGAGAGACVLLAGALASRNPRLFCFWGLILTIPLNLSKRVGPMFLGKPGGADSYQIEASDIFLALLAALIVWELASGRRRGIQIPKIAFGWILLIMIGVGWVVAGPWRILAGYEVFRMVKVLVLFIVVANELQLPGRLAHCAAALAVTAALEASVGLVQYAIKGLIGLEIIGETTSNTISILSATSVLSGAVFRPSGLLQHANILGIFLAVTMPLMVAAFMISRNRLLRLFYLATIALSAPGMIVTLSRSSWVSAAIGVGLTLAFMIIHPTLRWRALRVGTVVGIIGILVLGVFAGTIMDRLLRSKDDATRAREIYKDDALRMIAAAPWVGLGMNTYSLHVPDFGTLPLRAYGPAMVSVHQIYYLWWVETGIFGMLLFCAVWGSIILMGLANLTIRNEFLFAINAACLAATISLIPDGFLSFTLKVNVPLRMFWLYAGMIMAVRYLHERTANAEPAGVSDSAVSLNVPEPEPSLR